MPVSLARSVSGPASVLLTVLDLNLNGRTYTIHAIIYPCHFSGQHLGE